jgi:ferredoxin
MIVTRQKDFKAILRTVGNNPVFIVGCNECAKLCGTGGETEVLAMKQAFEKEHIPVTGWVVLEPACHLQNDKRLLKSHEGEIAKAEKILILACGNGIQTVAEVVDAKEVVTGVDTLFLGEIVRANEFQKRCDLCGDCLLDSFEGYCPVSRCPKSMLNGPCGGSSQGKCEINRDLECVWDRIYQDYKKQGRVHALHVIQKPKDWSHACVTKRSI